jgi:hypothetical protein
MGPDSIDPLPNVEQPLNQRGQHRNSFQLIARKGDVLFKGTE